MELEITKASYKKGQIFLKRVLKLGTEVVYIKKSKQVFSV
jgi:hypothetical protein